MGIKIHSQEILDAAKLLGLVDEKESLVDWIARPASETQRIFREVELVLLCSACCRPTWLLQAKSKSHSLFFVVFRALPSQKHIKMYIRYNNIRIKNIHNI